MTIWCGQPRALFGNILSCKVSPNSPTRSRTVTVLQVQCVGNVFMKNLDEMIINMLCMIHSCSSAAHALQCQLIAKYFMYLDCYHQCRETGVSNMCVANLAEIIFATMCCTRFLALWHDPSCKMSFATPHGNRFNDLQHSGLCVARWWWITEVHCRTLKQAFMQSCATASLCSQWLVKTTYR